VDTPYPGLKAGATEEDTRSNILRAEPRLNVRPGFEAISYQPIQKSWILHFVQNDSKHSTHKELLDRAVSEEVITMSKAAELAGKSYNELSEEMSFI
jgi:hypothetical protein